MNALKDSILDGMRSFVADMEQPYYPLEKVDECGRIIDSFLAAMAEAHGEAAILAQVQKTVLALNALNDECDGALIETDQREELCELIQDAAEAAGLAPGGDVTERWREW
ncbi:hypothetical protein [Pseudoduganella sp.]|uniref:hypothetical protein n=1 Tax=Pseudoduganella sp. TaxID=1880898 RepID=UPI0035AEFC7E